MIPFPEGKSTDFWAAKTPKGYRHLYPHPSPIRSLCLGQNDLTPVVPVRVTADKAGTYFAYWNCESGSFSMVYPHRKSVEICFPYGPEVMEREGKGLICPVREAGKAS
jgi:hypothetical protein